MVAEHLILDAAQIRQKIKRMAYEIYEHNFKEKSVVLAGIDGQGYTLARLLSEQVQQISPMQVLLVKVLIDKNAPQQSEIVLDRDIKDLRKKNIVLVDDVLNTGRTFAYGLKPFLSIEVKKIETAVLVNRSHPLFPIYPQYTGLKLSTTLKEHVEVRLDDSETAVYLH
jgi:pyrimidine operon attenuation protein / uracil phosphoribosyltransferase